MSDQKPEHSHSKRDSESFMMLGGFMTILAVPVLIGTFFAERPHAMVVNVIAGLVLLAIGIGFLYRGYKGVKASRQ